MRFPLLSECRIGGGGLHRRRQQPTAAVSAGERTSKRHFGFTRRIRRYWRDSRRRHQTRSKRRTQPAYGQHQVSVLDTKRVSLFGLQRAYSRYVFYDKNQRFVYPDGKRRCRTGNVHSFRPNKYQQHRAEIHKNSCRKIFSFTRLKQQSFL